MFWHVNPIKWKTLRWGLQSPVDVGTGRTGTEWRLHIRTNGRYRKRPHSVQEFASRNPCSCVEVRHLNLENSLTAPFLSILLDNILNTCNTIDEFTVLHVLEITICLLVYWHVCFRTNDIECFLSTRRLNEAKLDGKTGKLVKIWMCQNTRYLLWILRRFH